MKTLEGPNSSIKKAKLRHKYLSYISEHCQIGLIVVREGLKNKKFYISWVCGFEIINCLFEIRIKAWSWASSSPYDKKT